MTDARQRQPASEEAPHAIPEYAAILAAPRQHAMPEPSHLESEKPQRRCVHGHSVIPDVSTHHRLQPLALTPPRAATFIYHSHWHEQRQLGRGLTGPLIVLESGAKFNPATDKISLFSRDGVESNEPLLMNGSPQPAPMALTVGTTYRFRFINITPVDSDLTYSIVDATGAPVSWRAIAKDGADLPPEQATVKKTSGESITVGETRDYTFIPENPGELYLRASSFQRMWVTTTLMVAPPQP